MESRSKKRGFTLVELLVVISIIALLLAIIIPSMNKARETAKRVICSNQLKENARAIAIYADAYDKESNSGTLYEDTKTFFSGCGYCRCSGRSRYLEGAVGFICQAS